MKGNKGKQGRVGLRHLLQLPSCSPFLKPETLVPLKNAIVHMGSGQHGQVLSFTKCRHDLPDNLRLLHTVLEAFQEMKICIENQTRDTKDGAHHMPLHTQETRQKRAICVRFGEKISGGGGHVSSFERGGGALAWGVHWHEGGGDFAVLHPPEPSKTHYPGKKR